jgi:hypothetical protein
MGTPLGESVECYPTCAHVLVRANDGGYHEAYCVEEQGVEARGRCYLDVSK